MVIGLARWLSSSETINQHSQNSKLKNLITVSQYRLLQLGELGRVCKDQNEWQRKLKSTFGFELESFSWVTDDGVRKFFLQTKGEENCLSAGAGKGFY